MPIVTRKTRKMTAWMDRTAIPRREEFTEVGVPTRLEYDKSSNLSIFKPRVWTGPGPPSSRSKEWGRDAEDGARGRIGDLPGAIPITPAWRSRPWDGAAGGGGPGVLLTMFMCEVRNLSFRLVPRVAVLLLEEGGELVAIPSEG